MAERRGADRLKRALATLGVVLLFVSSAIASAVLHVDLPASRRFVASTLERVLASELHGTVEIEELEQLDGRHVVASRLQVRDVHGNLVLTLSALRARANLFELARRLASGDTKVDLSVSLVRADSAECELIPDPKTGEPTLLLALTPRPGKPSVEKKPRAEPRHVRVWLPRIEIGRAWVRGRVNPLPTLEASLTSIQGSLLATPRGLAIDVERFGALVRGLAGADARGTGSLLVRAPGEIRGSFDGYLGDVQLEASLASAGKHLSARLELPRAEPGALRSLWADWPLQKPIELSAEAAGDFPVLATKAHLVTGDARVSASGSARLAGKPKLVLDVKARRVDLRAVWPEAPATAADADANVTLRGERGRVVVDVDGSTEPTLIAEQLVPGIDVKGVADERGFSGKATLHEPGLPVAAFFSISPRGKVEIDARSEPFSIEDAPRLGKIARGRAEMRVKARIVDQRVDAEYTADLAGLRVGELRLGRGRLNGRASGDLAAPKRLDIDAELSGRDLEAGMFSFASVRAEARGPLLEPRLRASLRDEIGPSIQARGRLSAGRRTRVRDLVVAVRRGEAALSANVARLQVGSGVVELDRVKVTGVGGELTGEAKFGPRSMAIELHGRDLDLGRLNDALGHDQILLRGKLGIDAVLATSRDESRGRVWLELADGTIATLSGVAAQLETRFEGRELTGSATASLSDVATLGATFHGSLAGRLDRSASWRDAVGRADIRVNDARLDAAGWVLPKSWGIERTSGTANAHLELTRADPKALPSASVRASTARLELVRRGQPLRGFEIQLEGTLDGARGDAQGTTKLLLDGTTFASATGTSKVDLERLRAEPDGWSRQLLETPTQALLTLARRDLSRWPEPLRPSGVGGELDAVVRLRGTLRHPELLVGAHAWRLHAPGSRRGRPVDVRAQGRWLPDTRALSAVTELVDAGRRVARLDVDGALGTPGAKPWTGSAVLDLAELPIDALPWLADAGLQGRASGRVAVERSEALDAASAALRLEQTSLRHVPLGAGRIGVRARGPTLSAELDLTTPTGSLSATARGGLDWTGPVPLPDESQPSILEARAQRYPAEVLAPLVTGMLSRLGGTIDGKATLTLRRGTSPEGKAQWSALLQGSGGLRDGKATVVPLGLELEGVRFNVSAVPEGLGTHVDISSLRARARSPRENLQADVQLRLDGLLLTHGNGTLFARNVPLTLEGQSLGEAEQARATFELRRQPAHPIDPNAPFDPWQCPTECMLVHARISPLEAKLPRSSARSLIALGDNPDVILLQPLGEPRATRGDATPWRFLLELGQGVRLERSDLSMPIRGMPVIELAEETRVRGQVTLPAGGRLKLVGRPFVVDAGTVYFDTGDPSNPRLEAFASWRAPDATIVHAAVRGTLRELQLTLTSEPPREERELLALLLGGSSTGGAPVGSEEIATAGFGQVVSLEGVEVRTERAEGQATPSYTAAVQVSENVWVEGTYRPGDETLGEDAANDYAGAVDWRFHPEWSLRMEGGTTGGTLDMVWTRRY